MKYKDIMVRLHKEEFDAALYLFPFFGVTSIQQLIRTVIVATRDMQLEHEHEKSRQTIS